MYTLRENARIRNHCILGAIAIVAAIFLAVSFSEIRSWRQAKSTLMQRHGEATAFIKHVYQYHSTNGRWPTTREIGKSDGFSMPDGWQYASASGEDASLWLHGPYHMILSYQFAVSKTGVANRTWAISVEGDKSEFETAVQYRGL